MSSIPNTPPTPPNEGPMDPHRLANHYLDTYAKDASGRLTLRYWRGEFWTWEDGRYRPQSESGFAATLTRAIKQHVNTARLVNGNGQAYQVTKGLINNVRSALTGELLVPEQTDQPAWLASGYGHTNCIAMANGILNLDAVAVGQPNQLQPLNPEWFSATCIPYDYDPQAECPQWLAFLNRVLEGDGERMNLVQEWFGYLPTPDTRFHKFLVLEGEGANGKSVFLEMAEAVVGSANASHVPVEVMGDRFQLTMSLNKLVNIAPEVNETARLNEGVLKQFTAGDRMYFDRKGVSGVDAKPSARLMLATNHRPPLSDRSDGLWRRVLYLPFRITIPAAEQDHRLADKLKTELPGILNWALKGRERLYRNHGFTEPAVCKQAVEEYRAESNPTGIFLREQCYLLPAGKSSVDDLYQHYRTWATSSGYSALSIASFGKEVKRAFPQVDRVRVSEEGRRPWYYAGLACTWGFEASGLKAA